MVHLRDIIKKFKNKTVIVLSVIALAAGGLAFASPLLAHADADCTSTGFYRDGMNLTAAVVDPTATVNSNVDATGCNVGVYFGPGTHGTVDGATIHGANYYGVVVQQAKVTVENSNIYGIGEVPLNGDQHGVGIYYATVAGVTNGDCTTGSTTGTVKGNSVSGYQKGGIVVSCAGSKVDVDNNVVQGQGPVSYIAQNGIEFGVGAQGEIKNNIVTDNSYTGAGEAASGGILVYGGACYDGPYTTNIEISDNTVVQNDVGLYLSNLQSNCTSPANNKTDLEVEDNTVANASLNNTTGNGPTQGYQAGISDQGDGDTISHNTISGAGYNPANSSASIFTTWIDTSSTLHAKLHSNNP